LTAAVLSDAWFQVASARVSLLPTVRAQTQRWRGRPWVVLEDPYTNRFFRVTPEAYAFLRELKPEATVDEIWRSLVARHPQNVPGQDEVVRLLSQLHVSSLLSFRDRPHNAAIFERSQTQRRKELTGKLLAFLFVRIPLVSPDRWLDGLQPLIMRCTGLGAGVVWLAVVLAGAAAVLQNTDRLHGAGQGLLSLANLPWLYASITLVKVLHELAHAFVCKRYGGHVPTAGVMFLVLAPLPYVDASASWGLRDKWQRAYVGAAGMLSELFIAAAAAMVWVATSDGFVHSLAFNLMVVGSVSSLLFNGNPLLRFDAYYILSDLAELPNLYQKAQQQWLHYGARWLLGVRTSVGPATDASERSWYLTYGALAFFYRWSVTIAVMLFVTDQWFAVGMLMLATTLIAMVLMPANKLLIYLRGAQLHRGRSRALAGVGAAVALPLLVIALLPLPYSVRLQGVLEAPRSTPFFVPMPAQLVALQAQHGAVVQRGALLARFDNPDLAQQIDLTLLQITEVSAQQRQALRNSPGEVGPLQSKLDALRERQRELRELVALLELRAPQDGEWVAPVLHERLGSWSERGQLVGELVDRSSLRFTAVLPQSQAAELFGHAGAPAELRLVSRRSESLQVTALQLVPYQRQRLASASLGFSGGGEVALRLDDSTGTMAAEPFFELRAELADPAAASRAGLHGMSGVLRVELPPRPLWQRWQASLQQLLQQRYGVQS